MDLLLVERGLAETRTKSRALIMAGEVLVDDAPCDKPGTLVSPNSFVRLRKAGSRFVGRGGEKLEGALDAFTLDVTGVVAVDVGASTGGFTDCLLQRGASHVYCVDVGYNQLHPRLRNDIRVDVLERLHAKDLRSELFQVAPDFAVIDVSFIGLRKVLPFIAAVLAPRARVVALIKPQFELEPEHVEKGGVVRDSALQSRAIDTVLDAATVLGWVSGGVVPSVLRGEKAGNQEFFAFFTVTPDRS
ncbi:MAG: TlyA family RNA methyltransferase [Bdellovibrionales bacterium]|nr:TlyA family RNA methyltransferase [Bdellovibrionales bacterium]